MLDMWIAKAPAREIAQAIGRSKDAVLGIVYRLRNLGCDVPQAASWGKTPEQRLAVRRERYRARKAGREPLTPEPLPVTLPAAPEPRTVPILMPSSPISILSVGHFQCRAVTGYEGSFALFCGAPGRPWCEAHRAIYTVAEPTKGRRKVRISARTGTHYTGG